MKPSPQVGLDAIHKRMIADIDDAMSWTDATKVNKALAEAKQAIVSLLPEKKELEGLRNHTGGRGTKYKQAQGHNSAIDLMRERMEE